MYATKWPPYKNVLSSNSDQKETTTHTENGVTQDLFFL